MIFKQGSPVFVGNDLVAYMNVTVETSHDILTWKWLNSTDTGTGHLCVLFERGPLQILGATIHSEDHSRAFDGKLFIPQVTEDQVAAVAFRTLQRVQPCSELANTILDVEPRVDAKIHYHLARIERKINV